MRDNETELIRFNRITFNDINSQGPHDVATAVVYAGPDGRLQMADRRLTWRHAFTSRFTTRYVIDMSDHEVELEVMDPPLPARGDVYAFEATVHIGYRVTDPLTVVRRRIIYGVSLVYNRIVDVMRAVARDFDIEQSADAEAKINSRFDSPMILDEGLTVYRCVARLSPDLKAREYLQAKRDAARQLEIQAAEHLLRQESAQDELRLEALRHNAEIEHRRRELQELSEAELDQRRLLFLHLAKHPEDTDRVLAHLDTHEEKEFRRAVESERRQMELFQFMVNENLVNAIDVEVLRAKLIENLRRPANENVALPESRTWVDEPTSSIDGTTVGEPFHAAGQPFDQDGADHAGTTELMPIYLAIEESIAAAPWVDDLSDGIAGLCSAISASPDLASRVRLSVIGFSTEVTQYLKFTEAPELASRLRLNPHGRACYRALFTHLTMRLSTDLEHLTTTGRAVRRPVIFLLTGGRPAAGDWRSARARFLGEALPDDAPEIVVCGVGPAHPGILNGLATDPRLAFVARREADVATSLRRFFAALASALSRSGELPATTQAAEFVTTPDGFAQVGRSDDVE